MTENIITTRVRIFQPGTPPEDREVRYDDASYAGLRAVLIDLLGGDCDPEHVYVLYDGRPRDMFVDEVGQMKGLPRNETATAIYRANWLGKYPSTEPESLPDVVGPAVLFLDRIVWR